MRHHSPSSAALRRAAACGVAAVGLFAATLTAPAAYAAGPEFALGGPAEVAVQPYPGSGAPLSSGFAVWADNPADGGEGGGDFDAEYSVTVDFGSLAGVAEVKVTTPSGDPCAVEGTIATCDGYGIRSGRSDVAAVEVTAAEGSADGDSGTVEVTARAEGATFTGFTATVTIGGPDLAVEPLTMDTEPSVGDVLPAPIAFTNQGTRAAEGLLLSLKATRGMSFADRYDNCEYSEEDDGHFAPTSVVLCRFEGTYEPGVVYELAEPLRLKVTDRAYYDIFTYRVDEDSAPTRAGLRGGATFGEGSGGSEMKLEKRPVADSSTADLDPWDNYGEVDFRTENTADFDVYGDSADAGEGETVTAEVGFRNQGRAWVGYLRSGEPVATLEIKVPEGATVSRKPDECRGVTDDGGYREEQLGAPRYRCSTGYFVLEDADFALSFELTVDKVIESAVGKITFLTEGPGVGPLDFDPNKGNDEARLVLNKGDDAGSSGSTGSTGSTDGGDGTGGDGRTGGTDSSGATGGATGSGGAATGGNGGTGGGLAGTGAGGALLIGGAAAAALALGGGLFVATRRRTAAGNTEAA